MSGSTLREGDTNITATYDYTPYGTIAPYGTGASSGTPKGPGYTGHVNDPETNLVYMQARYYDAATGHFLSIDPNGPAAGNTFNFNRYDYVNNNPINHTDPTGKCLEDFCIGEAAFACAATPACSRAVMAAGAVVITALTVRAVHNTTATKTIQNNNSEVPAPTPAPTQAPDAAPTTDGNTNPYAGPVDRPVVVVDKNGNAIPVDTGNSISASPNGDYQQVKDKEGNPTGDRLDRGGHKTQSDPKAQGPHAHRPGVTDPDGNPHLPINPPSPPPTNQ